MAKIHSEILQIANHRFQLTTASLVFFATICAWTTGTVTRLDSTTTQGANHLPFLVRSSAGMSIVVLYVLFSYHLSFGKTIRWLSTYLMCRGSDWEWHYYVLRRGDVRGTFEPDERVRGEQPFYGYSIGSGFVFVAILLIAFCYFFALEFSFAGIRGDFWHWWSGLGVVVAATIISMVYRAGRVDNPNGELRQIRLWKSIQQSCAASCAPTPPVQHGGDGAGHTAGEPVVHPERTSAARLGAGTSR